MFVATPNPIHPAFRDASRTWACLVLLLQQAVRPDGDRLCGCGEVQDLSRLSIWKRLGTRTTARCMFLHLARTSLASSALWLWQALFVFEYLHHSTTRPEYHAEAAIKHQPSNKPNMIPKAPTARELLKTTWPNGVSSPPLGLRQQRGSCASKPKPSFGRVEALDLVSRILWLLNKVMYWFGMQEEDVELTWDKSLPNQSLNCACKRG